MLTSRLRLSLLLLAVVGLIVTVVSVPTKTAQADTPKIGGDYNVVGITPDNKVYSGTLNVLKNGDSYKFTWKAGDKQTSTGTGIQDTDGLSVGWGSDKCTVATYNVTKNGLGGGKWLPIGGSKFGTETASLNGAIANNKIAGTYTVKGTNPDGTPYSGNLTVAPSGKTYQFTWKIGSDTVTGLGVLWGDVVSVGFGDAKCAVATYSVTPDGSLSGLYGITGSTDIGIEQASVNIDGTYAVSGTNPDASTYTGELQITAHGPVYQFSWTVGKDTFEGIGIRQAGAVSVAWGDTKCGITSYQILDNDTLLGFVGTYGQDAIGAELLSRSTPTGKLSGAYEVAGLDFDNKSYTGKATVALQGDVYHVNWNTGDNNTESGVGAKLGDVLSIATGGTNCAFVAYQIDAAKTLNGVFATASSAKFGTEIAKLK